MATLNAAQRQQLALELKRFPAQAEQILAELEAEGYEIDRGEFAPVNWAAEADVFARRGVRDLTMGLIDPGESPLATQAGDVDLPLVGSVQPSALLGSLAGMLVPGAATMRAGQGLVRGTSMLRRAAQEGIAGGLFGAGSSAAQLARGNEVTGGEALTTMVADAVGFAALGLIGRGTLSLFRGAAAKQAAGAPLTPEEEGAVKEVTALMVVRQPLGPRAQLPPSTASGEAIEMGLEAGRGAPLQLPGGYRGPRRQLPPSTASGPTVFVEPWRAGKRRQLPPSTESGRPTIPLGPGGGGRLLLPRLTPETDAAVGGKPPEVIHLEYTAGELYRRIEEGAITSPQAMQAFQRMLDARVAMQQRPLVAHRAREGFRRAEGLPEGSGAPVTPDPVYRAPSAPAPASEILTGPVVVPPKKVAAAAPRRARRLPAQMTPYQVIRRAGGVRTDTLERLKKNVPRESGWRNVHLGKLAGGRQDITGILTDIRDSGGGPAQVLDDAGIHTEDDVFTAVRTGKLWQKYSTKQPEVQAEQAFGERPLDWDPTVEGFEERVVQAKSWDDLNTEVDRLDDAALAGMVTPEEGASVTSLISERAREIAEPPRPPLEMQPTEPGAAPAPRPPQQAGMPFGDVRELPRGPRRTSGQERLEGTPLEQVVVDQRATAARAAAPQGEMLFSGPSDVVPPAAAEAMRSLQLGDSVMLVLHDGSKRIGALARQEAPNAISLRAGGKIIRVDANQIKLASRIYGVRGGADDVSGPATQAQVRKLFALEGDLKKMGGAEKIGADPATMTRDRASARIRELELLRTERQAGNLDRLLEEADQAAAERAPRGAVEDGYSGPRGDLSAADAEALRAAVEEYGPEAMRDPSFFYARFFLPEISRLGFRRNPIGNAVWERGTKMVRDVAKESSAYLRRTGAAIKGLSSIDKFKLVKALDSEAAQIVLDPKLRGAYRPLRQVFDELAERQSLEPGQRISHYFPHLFPGILGRWRAIALGRELGPGGARRLAGKADELDLFAGRLDVAAGVPLQRFFAHILPRLGVDGFDLDLEKALYVYITGAIRKIHQDEYVAFAVKKLREVPRYDDQVRPMALRRYLAEHIAHAVGQPQTARQLVAKFWTDSQWSNSAFDQLVELVGGAPERGLLAKARRMGVLNRKASTGRLTPEETVEWQQTTPAEALNWVQKLVDDAQRHVDGVKVAPSMRRYRADMALTIDDFRAALGNPYRRGLLAEVAYPLMVVSKLGLNLAHGIVNLTQYVTNVVPVLDVRYAARGVRNLTLSRRDAVMLGGRRVSRVLDDLGVIHDTPKAQEFMDRRFGALSRMQDLAMTPSRATEQFMRGSAGLGAYEQALARAGVKVGQGATEAQHEAAIEFGRSTVDKALFPFNRVGTPKALRSSGMRLLLMFQSYPIHQMNFSAELIHDVFLNPRSAEAWGALTKHVLAYVTLLGVGASVGENFWDRTQHPVMDVLDLATGDQQPGVSDVFDLVSGPFAAALLHLLHGNVTGVAGELEPSVVRRTRTAQGVEELLLGTLLQDRPRARRGTTATSATR